MRSFDVFFPGRELFRFCAVAGDEARTAAKEQVYAWRVVLINQIVTRPDPFRVTTGQRQLAAQGIER